MDKIWSDYEAIAERAGVKVQGKLQKRLLEAYKKKNYDYFYHFADPNNQRFKVVDIDGKTYALDQKGEQFYLYRSPHYFKYFSPIKK